MGVMKRMSLIFNAKANKVLDRAEDPRETLDYCYDQAARVAAEGAAWRRRRRDDPASGSSSRSTQLQQQADKLEGQARAPWPRVAKTSPARR